MSEQGKSKHRSTRILQATQALMTFQRLREASKPASDGGAATPCCPKLGGSSYSRKALFTESAYLGPKIAQSIEKCMRNLEKLDVYQKQKSKSKHMSQMEK